MTDMLHEPESLGDRARHVGVRARTLNKVFRDFRDASPIALMAPAQARGGAARAAGGGAGARVVDIALPWGFPHLGRFAAFYRRHYGELPKETLCR
jgi:AraC family ethanolamine operon transcriptional activator